MALSEFELIARYFSDIGGAANGSGDSHLAQGGRRHTNTVVLGVGDDCALLALPPSEQLAISVDTLVADVHFPAGADAAAIARRALRVNLSDLAAMGATPRAFTLALTLPAVEPVWLERFAAGLRTDAEAFAIPLVGGDTTRGRALVITLQVMGSLPAGTALTRHGARPGDHIAVSGPLGAAAAAVPLLTRTDALSAQEQDWLERYWLPMPRLALGQRLRGLATAAIDISDGLAGDLGHILTRSKVGAVLEAAALPLAGEGDEALGQALHGGDDYELCFTVPAARWPEVERLGQELGQRLHSVGRIEAEPGLRLATAAGVEPLATRGYQHF